MALCSATKTTANITKTTENDRGGKEIKEISKKVTCSYMVSDLAYSAGACVEQLHLFTYFRLSYRQKNLGIVGLGYPYYFSDSRVLIQ